MMNSVAEAQKAASRLLCGVNGSKVTFYHKTSSCSSRW